MITTSFVPASALAWRHINATISGFIQGMEPCQVRLSIAKIKFRPVMELQSTVNLDCAGHVHAVHIKGAK